MFNNSISCFFLNLYEVKIAIQRIILQYYMLYEQSDRIINIFNYAKNSDLIIPCRGYSIVELNNH